MERGYNLCIIKISTPKIESSTLFLLDVYNREPRGMLGHSKEQQIHLLWSGRSGGSGMHCICRALTRESVSSLGSQIPGLLVRGVGTCLHSCLFTESVLEAGLWWTLLSG